MFIIAHPDSKKLYFVIIGPNSYEKFINSAIRSSWNWFEHFSKALTHIGSRKSYQLAEDLPEEYTKARHILMPVMTAARSNKRKTMFVSDQIRVDGHTY